jgi:3-oxoacyl-[acyl-carrier protein] reductase
MELGLRGKVALISGASRGIGAAIARALAAEGARLAICARTEVALQGIAADLASGGTDVLAVPADVTKDESVAALVAAAMDRFGAIDILVSNASALAVGPDRENWRLSLETDLMGAVRLCDAVLPHMRTAGSGNVLLISSVSAIEAAPMDDFGYTAAKAALLAFAKKLSQHEARHGIRVNALLPGSTLVPGGAWDQVRREQPDLYVQVVGSIPWGRMARPEEIADAAVWMVSDRAAWVTGQALAVDGGQAKGIR